MKRFLPKQHVELIESYLKNRFFIKKQEDQYPELTSVLGPILYLLYTCNIPRAENVTIATFADDTACLAVRNTIEEDTSRLPIACIHITEWSEKNGEFNQ